ncbi:MAG TPA: chitobiase/beta-hexosaminidase C-terminal domain-containing protein, partial [Acidobacteriaceae bacterium]
GGVSFFQATSGAAPGAQAVRIRNAGPGTMVWSAASTTSDGGAWLTLSATNGVAPSTLSIGVNTANLPGKGLTAGIFNGQIVLKTATDRQTIPITYVVGANVFKPLAPLSFTKSYGGANPATQTLSLASTATNFSFSGVAYSATGGNWLQITPSSYGCCTSTPLSVTVTANPATTLAAGLYVAQIVFRSNAGDQALIVPVNLTVNSSSAAATPTFTPPAGSYSSAQSVTINESTRGAAIYYTTDGTTPTTASKVFSAPISVTATQTIKAIAVAPGYPQSAVASAAYTITAPLAATPIATQTVAISEATQGATVYYTTNGSTPTTSSTKYTGPIIFSTSAVLKFIAVAPGYTQSAVRTVTVTVQ